MRARYRILRDPATLRYFVEYRRWWWPCWLRASGLDATLGERIDDFDTMDEARAFALAHATQLVEHLGRLPK